jgi:hexosaminidase
MTDNFERLVLGRGSGDVQVVQSAPTINALTLSLGEGITPNSITNEIQAPLESRDEAYSLYVPSDGSDATLSANSTLGLFRGLTTFAQLWYTYQNTTYALGVPINIRDSPAYVCGNSMIHAWLKD